MKDNHNVKDKQPLKTKGPLSRSPAPGLPRLHPGSYERQKPNARAWHFRKSPLRNNRTHTTSAHPGVRSI